MVFNRNIEPLEKLRIGKAGNPIIIECAIVNIHPFGTHTLGFDSTNELIQLHLAVGNPLNNLQIKVGENKIEAAKLLFKDNQGKYWSQDQLIDQFIQFRDELFKIPNTSIKIAFTVDPNNGIGQIYKDK